MNQCVTMNPFYWHQQSFLRGLFLSLIMCHNYRWIQFTGPLGVQGSEPQATQMPPWTLVHGQGGPALGPQAHSPKVTAGPAAGPIITKWC